MDLFTAGWFLTGIIGTHIIACFPLKDDAELPKSFPWLVVFGPAILLIALVSAVLIATDKERG